MSHPHRALAGMTVDELDLSAERSTAEKLPLPQATVVVISLSLVLWTAIGFGLRWLIA